jgi:hypothetical protein
LRRPRGVGLDGAILNRNYRVSYKIAIGFVLLVVAVVFGRRYYNDYSLGREQFPRLIPGVVNIVGVDTSQGYRILTQNRVAKLVFGGSSEFGPGEMDERSLESSGGEKKFIPIKDMLKGLQGDVPGLSYFVQRLNNISDDDLPAGAPVWTTEDIDKAIGGDKTLAAKLVHDLNAQLDGTPLDRISVSALQNGILVDAPVPLEVQMGDSRRTIVARVKRPYRAGFLRQVEERLRGKFETDKARQAELIGTQYSLVAEAVRKGDTGKEDIAKSLLRFKADCDTLARLPQRILNSVTAIVNENQIVEAHYQAEAGPKGPVYKIVLTLNDEGRKRLYQFSVNTIL